MNLQSMLLSSDDRTTRTLRRVLGELEIRVEHCSDADSAICSLTRRRFEAVIVDCDADAAAHMITSVRSAPGNRYAIVVAIVRSRGGAQADFAKEADFVLHKPVSVAPAKRSFRAARYLMKCQRRRNKRVPIEIPVTLISDTGKAECRTVTTDISENGMAVRLPSRFKQSGPIRIRFTLPGTNRTMECKAEVAWENAQSDAGFRFMDLSREDHENLKAWLDPYCFDFQSVDAPIPGNLTQSAHPMCAPATE